MSAVELARMHYEGAGDAPPLLMVPGLFGRARNWNTIAEALSDRGPVVAVDMRNHGESPHTESHGYEDMASDLAAVIDGQWDVLGHSMGGKAAMALALMRPEKVRRLVVADMAPVRYGHSMLPYVEAMQSVDLDGISTRRDADRALSERIDERAVRAFLLQSLDVREKRWDLNLDVLGREMDRIGDWPEMDATFERPALFLSGAQSDYVRPEHHDAIRAHFPRARFAQIPDAGHWLHAEKPKAVEESLRVFLDA